MTKIPIRTRVPAKMWLVAGIVTLYSLVSSMVNQSTEQMSVTQAKLISDNTLITSSIR